MPTQKYKSLDKAYQALTDFEIENDKFNFPVAIINVPGLHKIKIKMVNSYDFYYVLQPLQNKILNYFLNRFNRSTDDIDTKKLTEKIKNIVKEISDIKDEKDLKEKSESLSYLFDEEAVRKEFFNGLKRLRIIKWWVSWKRYELKSRPIDTLIIYCFLWKFNFDGVKKNVKYLIERITADTNYHLPTVSTSYGEWDTYKMKLQKAHLRQPWLNSSKN
jgi:hypothetical protein